MLELEFGREGEDRGVVYGGSSTSPGNVTGRVQQRGIRVECSVSTEREAGRLGRILPSAVGGVVLMMTCLWAEGFPEQVLPI